MTPEEFFEGLENKFLFVSTDEDRKYIAYHYGMTRKQRKENPFDSLEVDKIILIENIDKDEYRDNLEDALKKEFRYLEREIKTKITHINDKIPIINFMSEKIKVSQKYIKKTHMRRNDFETIPFKAVDLELDDLGEALSNIAYEQVDSKPEVWNKVFYGASDYLIFRKYIKEVPHTRAYISYVFMKLLEDKKIIKVSHKYFIDWLNKRKHIKSGEYGVLKDKQLCTTEAKKHRIDKDLNYQKYFQPTILDDNSTIIND
ncbi:Uncharacterised protein [Chryseobacterium taklimakanense]|uniref:Uncharacterized protein n=1 Tax=Chryseobacterium taklimakanense TaxID=536441 RepID=A0A239X670_9FLAO|nr:hypothetical protein [Chryseobacterium taklimakanense]SNV41494.1 Uncharacterised protein [Chryseobacterium taklimakanense]